MVIDAHVIQQAVQIIEIREEFNAPIPCYSCGLSPEADGGLCADCSIRHQKPVVTD